MPESTRSEFATHRALAARVARSCSDCFANPITRWRSANSPRRPDCTPTRHVSTSTSSLPRTSLQASKSMLVGAVVRG